MTSRILIIEDNPESQELLKYLLEAFGHRVFIAADGVEGWAIAQKESIDLLICDIHLPKLDGYGVIKNIKGHVTLKKVPTIAVTALAMVGDRTKILMAGFDEYVPKPIEPEKFIELVEKLLRRSAI
jgi:DNA-binding response OmpR family regulator